MILVGTSGWSYDEWVGPFYPVALRADKDAWIRYYATRFRTVEISSTFDATPDDDLVASWARAGIELQAAGPFEFSLKAPRALTHDAVPAGDLDGAWEVAARFERHVLEPLADEGLLGAVLVQLPPGVPPRVDVVRALSEALRAWQGRSVAIEIRDASWAPGGLFPLAVARLFDDADVALAELDGPGLPRADAPPARHAYLRLHGRRADLWARPRADEPYAGARYDYLYAPGELAPWAARARAHDAAGRAVRVYFNNTPHAKGVVNGVEMLHLLGAADGVPRPRLTQQTRLSVGT